MINQYGYLSHDMKKWYWIISTVSFKLLPSCVCSQYTTYSDYPVEADCHYIISSLHNYTTPTQAGIYFAPIVSTFSRIISHSLWQGKPTKHPSMLMKGWIKNDECYDNITIALLQPHKLPISLFSFKYVSFNLQQADFLKIFLS